jgi:voltage-gated potassium channel
MKLFQFRTGTLSGFILLFSLIFLIFLLPVFPPDWQPQLSTIACTVLYFSAVFSLERRIRSILILSIIVMIMEWVSEIFSLEILNIISKVLNVSFFIIIMILLIRQIATSREINLKVILGSIIGYLLLGFVYSILVGYIMHIDPSAFSIPKSVQESLKPVPIYGDSVYFSFVTVATLGYGDIVPIEPYARSLTIWITVSGQLYIATVIALLIGKFSTKNTASNSESQ